MYASIGIGGREPLPTLGEQAECGRIGPIIRDEPVEGHAVFVLAPFHLVGIDPACGRDEDVVEPSRVGIRHPDPIQPVLEQGFVDQRTRDEILR